MVTQRNVMLGASTVVTRTATIVSVEVLLLEAPVAQTFIVRNRAAFGHRFMHITILCVVVIIAANGTQLLGRSIRWSLVDQYMIWLFLTTFDHFLANIDKLFEFIILKRAKAQCKVPTSWW